MTCATCGRDNPAHLTFCQECGQRLGPRIAPPTPPIGLQDGSYEAQAMPPRVATNVGAVASPLAPLTTTERRCRVCDTMNGPGLRYCVSCGSTLEPVGASTALMPSPVAAPLPPITSPPPPRVAPTAAMQAQPAPQPSAIAPMRVVELAVSPPQESLRACTRCRGIVDAHSQFCKFCGAKIGDSAPSIPAASPRPAPEPAAMLAHERIELPRKNGSAPQPTRVDPPPPAPVASPAPVVSVPTPAPIRVAPAPAPAASRERGRLVVIAKSGADGPSYPLTDTVDIGRSEGNIIVAEDPYLSPRHVRIVWLKGEGSEPGRWVLRDLASTNGVFLRLAAPRNRRGTAESTPGEVVVPLEDQDLILVGQQVLRFEVVKDAESGLGAAVEHGTLLFGSPAAPRYARLGQRTVEGVTRDVYYMRKVETVLGRESGDVVFTEDPFLSRRHAAIRILARDGSLLPAGTKSTPDGARFALVDLASSNGTFIRIRGKSIPRLAITSVSVSSSSAPTSTAGAPGDR